jgi:hypothetical protein
MGNPDEYRQEQEGAKKIDRNFKHRMGNKDPLTMEELTGQL